MGGGSNSMSEHLDIEIRQQTAFGDDGQLEVTESSVETSLEDFGADADHRERDSRIDRSEVTRSSESNQSNLLAETAEDQQTLTGDDAAMQCLFGE